MGKIDMENGKKVLIKLKEFDEIVATSTVVPILVDNTRIELFLQSIENRKSTVGIGLFNPRYLYPKCGEWIEVIDKADYEFADTYCYYSEDGTRIAIGDWMVDETKDIQGQQ